MITLHAPDDLLHIESGRLIIAGWTGRDEAAVAHHVEELAALGVPRPSATPLFYRVSAGLLTLGETITVLGGETSGEVEPLLVRKNGQLWLGLGSDHTDRGLEAHSVAHSKQVCPKPVAGRVVPLRSAAWLEEVVLRCWIDEGEGWVRYQEGALTAIRPLLELVEAHRLEENDAMLCGTLPALGGVRAGRAFRMTLSPPDAPEIALAYSVRVLPVVA